MSTKKSYMSLLKEAIAEFDTSDNLEVKGPMLDPILSWDGGGELPVYKDAASILERYYFNENNDEGVNVMDEGSELEASSQNDKGSAAGEAMKHTKGTGTEQAGTSDSATVLGGKDEKAKDIAKEDVQLEQDDEDEEDDDAEKIETEDLEMENAIIEKLISEMEDEEKDEDEDAEKVETEAEVMNYTGDGPKTEAPKEKKASGPEEDTQGAGTNQAGTGGDEKQLPDRKDKHNTAVDPKKYTDENAMIEVALAELEKEISEQDAPEEVPEEEPEEKDLDVDKEMAKEQAPPAPSAVPGGPAPDKEGTDDDVYEEAFKLFKEAIEDEDEKEEKGEEKKEEKDE